MIIWFPKFCQDSRSHKNKYLFRIMQFNIYWIINIPILLLFLEYILNEATVEPMTPVLNREVPDGSFIFTFSSTLHELIWIKYKHIIINVHMPIVLPVHCLFRWYFTASNSNRECLTNLSSSSRKTSSKTTYTKLYKMGQLPNRRIVFKDFIWKTKI